MSDERRKILQMLKDGKISLDEADELLNSLDASIDSAVPLRGAKDSTKRFIKIEVNDKDDNVKVNVPLSLAKIAMSLIPKAAKAEMERAGIDPNSIMNLDSIIEAAAQDAEGELVNVQSADGSTVKIYFD